MSRKTSLGILENKHLHRYKIVVIITNNERIV